MRHVFFSIFLFASILVTGPAVAGMEHTVSGWAWSDTAGWISFNCANVAGECDRSNYGVTIDPDTGQFSGYAWSDNFGWVSFTRDTEMGTPPAPPFNGNETYSAFWNKTTNTITGWAQILSMGSGGWLQFRDASLDPMTARFSGWMWNGNSDGTGIGWVTLTSVMVAQTVVNFPPIAPTATAINNTTITEGAVIDTGKTALAIVEPITSLQPTLQWTPFSDLNGSGDSQKAYEIVIEEQLPDGTWQVLYTHTAQNDGNAFRYPSGAPPLQYGTTYRWKVRVQDAVGAWSPYSEPVVFTAPLHALPQLRDIVPSGTATTEQTIEMDGSVIVPEGVTVTNWHWDFGDGTTLEGLQTFDEEGNPTGVNYITPLHTYDNACNPDGSCTVTLTVTDSDGYVVMKTMSLMVRKQALLPIWRRIIPF